MNHEEWLETAEIYAVGALDGEELRLFEAHLADCRICEARIRESREILTVLPRALEPVAPPDSIKEKLLRRIADEKVVPIRTRSKRKWLKWGVGSAALAAAAVLLVVGFNLIRTRGELERLQSQIAALQTELGKQEEMIAFLSNPQVRLVNLAGLPGSPGATGRVLWDPMSRNGFLLAVGLPEVPPEKDYELWGIAGNEPVPAGVFKVDRYGRAVLRMPRLPEEKTFDKFAVTLEPAGGVPQPTGPMLLLGSL